MKMSYRSLFVVTLLIFSLFAQSAFGMGENALGTAFENYSLNKVNPENLEIYTGEDNDVNLEPILPREFMENKPEIGDIVLESKLLDGLRNEIDSGVYDENSSIYIVVSLMTNNLNSQMPADVDLIFERKIDQQFNGEVKYKKLLGADYEMYVTLEQLAIIENMEEVLVISGREDMKEIPVNSVNVKTNNNLRLNTATRWHGIIQARSDFNVTGNIDGNENVYSKNDAVIAIIDSGIDTSLPDLDGGKVIAFYDAVNDVEGLQYCVDNDGHGTAVASVAAASGDANSAYTGVAPGAALVIIRVFDTSVTAANIYKGLFWSYNNIDNYNINVVSMSISGGHHASINMTIGDIRSAGVPVFVGAGNSGDGTDGDGNYTGKYYDTLTDYHGLAIGSVKDPVEGGGGLSKFSSRGTSANGGTVGPYMVASGEDITYNSANGVSTVSGTSFSTPLVAGVFALMYNAKYNAGGGSIGFTARDFGEDGFDKNYGGGNIQPYQSIQNANGSSNTSFEEYGYYLVDRHNSVDAGFGNLYQFVNNSTQDSINITLITLSENKEDLYLAIWLPGQDPSTHPAYYTVDTETELPQEFMSINIIVKGTHQLAVFAKDNAEYSLEITGRELDWV